MSSHEPKGPRFRSWSGHTPRLWVQSLVGAHMGGNLSVFLSHIDIPLSLSSSLSLKKFISVSSGEDFKKLIIKWCQRGNIGAADNQAGRLAISSYSLKNN